MNAELNGDLMDKMKLTLNKDSDVNVDADDNDQIFPVRKK